MAYKSHKIGGDKLTNGCYLVEVADVEGHILMRE